MATVYNKNGTNGADTIYVTEPGINVGGGYGNDTFIVRGAATNNTVGSANAEYGNDTLKIQAGDKIRFYNYNGSNTMEIAAGSDHYMDTGNKADYLTIKSSADQVEAHLGAGENVITINAGTNHNIYSENGSDTLLVGYMESSGVSLGAGENKITLNGGFSNSISSGDDKDTITVNKGYNNTINAGGGDDVFYINEGAGSNKLYLGKGSDRVTVNTTSSQAIYIHDSANTDKNVLVMNAGSGHSISLSTAYGANEIYVKNTNNILQNYYNADSKDKVVISSGTGNSFNLGGNNDMGAIRGGSNNSIHGGDGTDTLSIEGNASANNTLYGGYGDDNLYVNAGVSGVQTLEGGGNNIRDSFNVNSEKAIVHISATGQKGSFVLNKGTSVDKDGIGHTVTSRAENNFLYIGKDVSNVASHVVADISYGNRLNRCLIYGSDNSVSSSSSADNVYIRSGERNYVDTYGGNDYIYIDGGNNHTILGGGGSRDNFYVNMSLNSNTRLTFDQSGNNSNTDILHLENEYKRNFSYSYDSSTDSLLLKKSNGALITVSNWKGNGLGLIKFKNGEEIKFNDSYSVVSSNNLLSADSVIAAGLLAFNADNSVGSELASDPVLFGKPDETMFITSNVEQ